MKYSAASALALFATALAFLPASAMGQRDILNMRGVDRTAPLKQVGIDQRLGGQLPLDAQFTDEAGRSVHLGDYFHKRPVVMAFVYYDCPMLCSKILEDMVHGLKAMTFTPGQEYEVVVISFDARERPAQAAEKKAIEMKDFNRPGTSQYFHFLTGDPNNIKRVTGAAGFRFAYDVHTNQFAHASAIYVVTPEGKMARYYYGLDFAPKDIRLGLIEASENKIGNPVDQLLLFCYHYDPSTGKYTPLAMNILRAAGGATIFALGGLILVMIVKERKSATARRYRI